MITNKFILEDWEYATNRLANYFTHKYFGTAADTDWVANEVGGVWCVADYFFSVDDMVQFIRHKYSAKMMFEYYEFRLANYGTDYTVCIRDYKKLKRAK